MISLGDLVITRQLMFHDVLLFSLPLQSLRSVHEPLSSPSIHDDGYDLNNYNLNHLLLKFFVPKIYFR